MPRRILLCTLGATPQIITETADALLDDQWHPDVVEVITTAPGVQAIVGGLFGEARPWAMLFGGSPPPLSIYAPSRTASGARASIIAWANGQETTPASALMEDVSTTEEAERMADAIKDRLWHWIQQPDTEIHLSIAGGRKTMSAHALIALALLGRAQDEASHVLVEKPYENYRQFWHRRQGGKVHSPAQIELMRNKIDPGPPEREASTVEVTLLRVPVPLVAELRETDRKIYGAMSFSILLKQIALANRFKAAPRLVLNDGTNTVSVCGEHATLPPVEYAKLRLLVEAVRNGWESEVLADRKHKQCLAADGDKVFLPVGVLLGWTAKSNRVTSIWMPLLAQAQTVASREEDQAPRNGRSAARNGKKPKTSPMEALADLAAENDDALQMISQNGDLANKRLRSTHETATNQFASFTELRGLLTSRFGGFLANELLPQSGTSPKLARFRLNCSAHAIEVKQAAV